MNIRAYKHACVVYEALDAAATYETIEGVRLHIYRGKVTELYHGLGISQSYYSSIFKGLKNLGCITQLERGDKVTSTAYVLHFPPDLEGWKKVSERNLTPPPDFAILSQRVGNLESQLGGINIGEVLELIQELDERLRRVEKRGKSNGKK